MLFSIPQAELRTQCAKLTNITQQTSVICIVHLCIHSITLHSCFVFVSFNIDTSWALKMVQSEDICTGYACSNVFYTVSAVEFLEMTLIQMKSNSSLFVSIVRTHLVHSTVAVYHVPCTTAVATSAALSATTWATFCSTAKVTYRHMGLYFNNTVIKILGAKLANWALSKKRSTKVEHTNQSGVIILWASQYSCLTPF